MDILRGMKKPYLLPSECDRGGKILTDKSPIGAVTPIDNRHFLHVTEQESMSGTHQFNTTILYRHQSEGLFLFVTKAVTLKAQASLPATFTPIL